MKTCDGVEFTLDRYCYYQILSEELVVLTPQSHLKGTKLWVPGPDSVLVVDVRWLATEPHYRPTPAEVLRLFHRRAVGTWSGEFYEIPDMEDTKRLTTLIDILKTVPHKIFYSADFGAHFYLPLDFESIEEDDAH